MDLRGHLHHIQAPTLVVSGAGDLATSVEHQREIAGSIPGARHELVGPAAHIAAVEQPETINRLIAEFLLD
jgi:3-oxoadipate enol-lactonase